MHYYGTRLSENISRREPEGYLLCLNVPVARTGAQEYLKEELGIRDGPALVTVFRPEEEVFSPETVASFEGMPVTDGHPPDGVDATNIRALQKGHAHNVRRGGGGESDLLLADLIITDPYLIRQVLEEGKREISCGYTYRLCEENGRYIQRKIRGNHVAVVDAGRAGARVSIKDEQPSAPAGQRRSGDGSRQSHCKTNLKGATTMKKSLSRILARMAKDGDVETVAEILGEMIEPDTAAEADEEENTVVSAENETAEDEATLDDIAERLDRIIALLTPAAADDDPAEEIAEAVGEAVAAAVAEPGWEDAEGEAEVITPAEVAGMVEEIVDPVVSGLLEAEEEPAGDCGDPEQAAKDALRAALSSIRPALMRMPRTQRRKVAADIAARMRGKGGRSASDSRAYAALASAARRRGDVTADLGRKIMARRNANARR